MGYCKSMSDSKKETLTMKLKASEFFKGRRTDYKSSIRKPFESNSSEISKVNNSNMKIAQGELKLTKDQLIITKKGKPTREISLNKIKAVKVSSLKDQTIVFEIEKGED